jgi:protein-S-isoprenylcysteine O-methyltransferase Ste14
MADGTFRLIVAAILTGFVAHRGFYTRKIRHHSDAVRQRLNLGRRSRIAGLLALPGLVGTLLYVLVPSWMAWSALPLPNWLRWVGVAVALGGFVLLEWSHRSLESNWSDAPVLLEGQELITRGPYHWVRHPIYTSFLLVLGSLLLVAANWFVGGVWIVMTGLDVTARMDAEEAMLLSQFGERYRAYANRTGRLFVRLSGKGDLGA